ncbi:MAG: sensor histidine kinase N-terminal domain-containing protein [Betaproteobacteria bacterium]|uniref:histidine kinase n=1 Tax=Candidatus Proximibacter danicus TaxID=2954365 RepID=A0A9D7JYN7_9PROT|nr:sensor histidine kinase N-terminal domain-containing protein [Candidatus Proximibacter danicus]
MSATLFRTRSLRWRLLRWVTLTTIVIWSLAAALSYHQARAEVQELMDGQIAKMARLLLAQIHEDTAYLKRLPENMASLRGTKSRRSELPLEFQIGYADGTVLVRSPKAPGTPLTRSLGYANVEHEGKPWRSLMLETADGRYRVQVAHSFQTRDREALEIATKTVLPLALLLPLMIALLYFAIRRGLKPLDELADDVASRSPDNLATLQPATELLETRPLVSSLNRLLSRLATTLDNERRFTADAAHELRTPLAALKVQAQVALATRDPEESRHAMAQVLAGADRSTRLVEQLLRLARLDPLVQLPDPQPIDLADLAYTTIENARDAASAKQQKLTLSAPESGPQISGDPDLLAVVLRNLVDNALRYTPAGGHISVSTGLEHGTPFMAVTDNGPGAPEKDLPRLGNRFYRSSEAGGEGSGLGLAIVGRIAELHGARLHLSNGSQGGFTARIDWQVLPPAP